MSYFDATVYANEKGFDLFKASLEKYKIQLPEDRIDILHRVVGLQTLNLNLDWFGNLDQDFYRLFREHRTMIGHKTLIQALIGSEEGMKQINFTHENWFKDLSFNLFKIFEAQILKNKNIQPKHILAEELEIVPLTEEESRTIKEEAERIAAFAEHIDVTETVDVVCLTTDGLTSRKLIEGDFDILSGDELVLKREDAVYVDLNADGDIVIACPYSGSTDVYKIDSETYAAFGVDKPFRIRHATDEEMLDKNYSE